MGKCSLQKVSREGSHSHLAPGTVFAHNPQIPHIVILSLRDPCVLLDAGCSRKPSWHGVVSVSEAFSTCTYHIPTRLVKQAFSFNTVRSLYSQQQTHGLRLADTTCLFLPTPSPSLPHSVSPSKAPCQQKYLFTNKGSERTVSEAQTSLSNVPPTLPLKAL